MTTTTTIPNLGTGQGTNPLKALLTYGQSPWMDYIRRDLLTSGELKKYIDNDGLRGMTSNPAIFEKAITGSDLYVDILNSPEARKFDANGLFEKIALRDVRDACDIFKPVYTESKRRDGYVSLEVSPFLGFDTKASLAEARRLWKAVDRPNVMIKIPGTPEGLPAIRQALEEGININITLLFAIQAHERVIEAYMAGLEDRIKAGQPIDGLASVASFFVSRVDTEVDKRLDALIAKAAELSSAPVPRKTKHEPKPLPDMHPEFEAALARSAKAKATFDAFSPSCRREYLEWVTEAKQNATRQKRIATSIEWLSEGKRRNWKYENC